MTDFSMASLRDPSGKLILLNDCALRIVYPESESIVSTLLSSPKVLKLIKNGAIVVTNPCNTTEAVSIIGQSINSLRMPKGVSFLRHERIPFVSYPFEWPPEMLHAAACLTVEIMGLLLDEGIGLKDATPYNILFRGTSPVFVDFLSFEKRDKHDPTWLCYAQFMRMFLVPLLASKKYDYPLDALFLGCRDGMDPNVLYGIASPLQRLKPLFFSLVSMPTWLGRSAKSNNITIYTRTMMKDADKACFILRSLLWRMKRLLERLRPENNRTSVWKNYTETNSYSDTQFKEKQEFVSRALQLFAPKAVLDIGSNAGLFSRLAAISGARVVAIDSDNVVVGDLWRNASSEQLDILPLVVNIACPTPAVGWKNAECSSFLDRARGAFDAVFMLAVIHHLLVTEGIPLAEIIDLASELTTDLLVIEFVSPDDAMFRKLARGRDHLYTWLTPEVFEHECRRRFEIFEFLPLVNTKRILYVMRKPVS
jgi:SAM-dependent methyltransferase